MTWSCYLYLATLRRLPAFSVQRTHVVSKVTFQEHPAFSGLGSLDDSCPGLLPKHGRGHAQKLRSFVEIEGSVAATHRLGSSCSQWPSSRPFLTGLWYGTPIPGIGKISTVLAFDIGVYLVVLGTALLIVFTLAEAEEER